MRQSLFSLLLVVMGSGMWWLLASTARFSVKKWDAKFETVGRTSLSEAGVTNADVLTSVHRERTDADGTYVSHDVALRRLTPAQRGRLIDDFRSVGADVESKIDGADEVLFVRRGRRTYQEIRFPILTPHR